MGVPAASYRRLDPVASIMFLYSHVRTACRNACGDTGSAITHPSTLRRRRHCYRVQRGSQSGPGVRTTSAEAEPSARTMRMLDSPSTDEV